MVPIAVTINPKFTRMVYHACTPKSLGDGNVSWLGLQTLKLECLDLIPGSAIISSETLGKLFNLSIPLWTP